MPDIYKIVDTIRRNFIDESIKRDTLMYNIWFEWDGVVFH